VAATATAVVTAVVPPLGPVHARLGGAPAVRVPAAVVPGAAAPAGAAGDGMTAGTGAGPSTLPAATGRGTARTVASGTGSPAAAPSGSPAGTGTPASRLPSPGPTGGPAQVTATPTALVPTIGVPTAIIPTGTPSPVPTGAASSGGSPRRGTLTVSCDAVLLSPVLGGSLRLTANGGPVSWSVREPASVLGSLTVSPSSGTLYAGQSVAITVTAPPFGSLTTRLTVEPGDQPVTVLVALG